jgi:hypothetical protein
MPALSPVGYLAIGKAMRDGKDLIHEEEYINYVPGTIISNGQVIASLGHTISQ